MKGLKIDYLVLKRGLVNEMMILMEMAMMLVEYFLIKPEKNTFADELQSSTFCSVVSFSLSAFFEGGAEKEKVQ